MMTVGDEDDFEAREEKLRNSLVKRAEEAIKLRSKDREFHGLEREFRYHQAQMLLDFNKSKDIKHPRDVGDVRETILRRFLTESGLLPSRYAVSDRSIRVASRTGHLSKEIDIAIFDRLDSISLMNREDTYQVLPLESVYGVIQVKSRLNKKEIQDGLANLASFKSLNRPEVQPVTFTARGGIPQSKRGFGILFAYDSDLKWNELVEEIELFSKAHPNTRWANGIFILNRGFFLHGRENQSTAFNGLLEDITSLQMHGFPDRDGMCLYNFQSVLLALLRNTMTWPAEIDAYFRLPLVADEHSYSFHLGNFAEVGKCDEHGPFQRKISADQLEKVISWCRTTEPINWVRATHLANGMPEDEEAYKRQPSDVYIYNPNSLPLSDILQSPTQCGEYTVQAIAYDIIQSAGVNIIIPFYYSVVEGIVSSCPKCPKNEIPTDGPIQ